MFVAGKTRLKLKGISADQTPEGKSESCANTHAVLELFT